MKGQMGENDQTLNEWRKEMHDGLEEVRVKVRDLHVVWYGIAGRSGVAGEHKTIMKVLFGDPETKSMGLLVDVERLKSFKWWITNSCSAAIGVAATVICYKIFGVH